jgi:probable F420-dependent oxidoreductase
MLGQGRCRPFRFGVGPGGLRFEGPRQWADLARQLEDLGFSTLSVGDHITGGYGPISAMTAAACATAHLRVGALTFCNDYRHPLVLAQEIATVDAISSGRVEVGLGAGWMEADYEQSGITMDPAKIRIERLAEAVAILNSVWGAGATATGYEGKHYRVTAHTGRPTPVQRPRPPILIGGSGPRVLALAAREADIVGLNVSLHGGTLTAARGRSATRMATLEKLRVIKESQGTRWPDLELEVYVHVVALGSEQPSMLDLAADSLGISPAEAAESPHVLVGSTAEVCDRLVARREELGISYISVSADAVAQFAPIVSRLAGT